MRPRRIHLIGGPGSGKTSLSVRIAARTGLPVHHLDDVARVGGGTGPLRPAEERAPLVERILASDAWITEGVHVGWTERFLERAELVVWLDYVSWPTATRRIVRRFVGGALREVRTRRGRERFTRFGDYGRQLRALGGAMLESRRYYATADLGASAPPDADGPSDPDSRSATAALLEPYRDKLVHCRGAADVTALLERLG